MTRPERGTAARAKRDSGEPSTYERLLTAAATLFREKGYGGTTTREMASLVGVQRASMYHHITGKEDLLFELCITAMDRMDAVIAQAVEGEVTALAKLQALIRTHVATMLENPDRYAVSLMELRALGRARRQQVLRRRRDYESFLTDLLHAGQAEGSVRGDVDARNMALLVLGTVNWTIFWYHPSGEVSPEGMAELVLTLVLEGVAAREASATPGKHRRRS